MYTLSEIARITGGIVHSLNQEEHVIRDLLIDSRRLIQPENCLFVALVSGRNDGHRYIPELFEKGVKSFLVSSLAFSLSDFPGASFIKVPDTLIALQILGTHHRNRFDIPVIGITGSNGKTIIKEWLYQLLNKEYRIVRSPKSYNSQIGVPLSVWKMDSGYDMAIFEAGISQAGEMENLESIIRPTIGIFTNIGTAHDEHFAGLKEKVQEKLKLFRHCAILVYCSDHALITSCLKESAAYTAVKTFTWSRHGHGDLQITRIEKASGHAHIRAIFSSNTLDITIPFTDDASIENTIHCWALMLVLKHSDRYIGNDHHTLSHDGIKGQDDSCAAMARRLSQLTPIAMRLELKEAINHCSLINDSYNSDINSLVIALDFMIQQNHHRKKTVVLSDILQSGRNKEELYQEIAQLLALRNIDRIIGIGKDIALQADKFTIHKTFYETTEEFLNQFPVSSFQNETILLKGARVFEFERISSLLQQKAHETVLEINIDALIHNLNYYRSALKPGTKTMAMVKAFSYGSGSYEIANVLQFHRIDYLAVAYADEGVELRKAGIHLPVMVMSPEEHSLDTLLKYNLEPEIYNLRILRLLEEAIERNQTSIQEAVRIHIKLDTGMHRLGFMENDLNALSDLVKNNRCLHVQSVFSHLAASEDPDEDDFSLQQIRTFHKMSKIITQKLDYPVLLHILNSAGILRFPETHLDMVRLGIGLYGVGYNPEEQSHLCNVSTLKSVITQIKKIPAGETIGYNRTGKAEKDTILAVVPIGYADGLDRKLGNGRGGLFIRGRLAPILGNICMDLTLVDITGIQDPGSPIREGDEVIVFGDIHPVAELAKETGTIPYEVLTGISRRVKRIYYHE